MRAAVAAAAVLLVAACGGGDSDEARRDPFTAIEREFHARPQEQRAAPRWERLTTLEGTGAAEPSITVDKGAIQWRVTWSCRTGTRFSVTVAPAPSGPSATGGRCPARGTQEFIGTGPRQLEVEAAGPWRVLVEQQVETPLREAPLAGARTIARGRFHRVERPSAGTALLQRLPSGRLALRLEDFRTSNNSDLFVWISPARDAKTTRQVLSASHTEIALLKATAGDQNYRLPPRTRASDIRSVVIWCEPVRIAYAAAPLRR